MKQTTKPEIDVDEYLEQFPEEIRRLANTLRELVTDTVPGSIERVYPGWKLIGYRAVQFADSFYFCFIYPTNEKVTLGFEYGTLLDDPANILEGTGSQVRAIVITTSNSPPKKTLRQYIHEAARIAVERKLVPKKGKTKK